MIDSYLLCVGCMFIEARKRVLGESIRGVDLCDLKEEIMCDKCRRRPVWYQGSV